MKGQIKNQSDELELVNCNLCAARDYVEVTSYQELRFVKCKVCGLIYRNPRLKEKANRQFYKSEYYRKYEGIKERISGARITLYQKVLIQLENKIKSAPRKILDIGCGEGNFLKLAKDFGWEVTGIEPAESACDYAKKTFGIDIVNKNLEEADFKNSSFDVVTLWNVLDHLLEPLETLKEIKRILKPDGILVMRVPNVNFHLLIHRIFLLFPFILDNKRFQDPSVVTNYGFSMKTIKKMLKKAGFIIIRISNSPLSIGDPYKSFGEGYSWRINVVKNVYYLLSSIVFILSLKYLNVNPSLLVYVKN